MAGTLRCPSCEHSDADWIVVTEVVVKEVTEYTNVHLNHEEANWTSDWEFYATAEEAGGDDDEVETDYDEQVNASLTRKMGSTKAGGLRINVCTCNGEGEDYDRETQTVDGEELRITTIKCRNCSFVLDGQDLAGLKASQINWC